MRKSKSAQIAKLKYEANKVIQLEEENTSLRQQIRELKKERDDWKQMALKRRPKK